MNLPRYDYTTENKLLLYEFTSQGPRGAVKKIVEYSRTKVQGIYNLAFGDYDEISGEINDHCISNNGDSQTVLATVASTLYAFTGHYPGAWIYATGSCPARTRLYRMGISNHLDKILVDFEVFGLRGDNWEEFRKGIDYKGFMVRKKIVHLKYGQAEKTE